MPDSVSRSRAWKYAAPVVFAACGLLLITSAKAADGTDLRTSSSGQLTDLVRQQEERVARLEQQAEQTRAEVAELAEAAGGSGLDELGERIAELQPVAGVTAVEGPGLTVTLDDAPLPNETGELNAGTNIEDYIVHQQDLEGVMNALWAGGAEAMMVMDQRVISSTYVRCVGPVLLVNGRRYAPPYTISVIGDVEALQQSLDAAPAVQDYRAWADRIGLGYAVDVSDEIAVPAFEGPLGPGEDGTP